MLKIDESMVAGDLCARGARALEDLVGSIPGARCVTCQTGPTSFSATITTQLGVTDLDCQVRSRAWPVELYALAHRSTAQPDANNIKRVVVAPYFSPQAIETCRGLGLGWLDLCGNGELNLLGAFIRVLGLENSFPKSRGTKSLYSPKSSRVVEVLLNDPSRKWTIESLADAARVSPGQVSSVRKLLEQNAWIESGYGFARVTQPEKLLRDWAGQYQPKRTVLRYFTLESPAEFEVRVAETLKDYAFTEFSAAERYAPYTRHQRVAFYATEWTLEMVKQLDLKRGDSASNVTVYLGDSSLGWIDEVGGASIASPIRTFLDLQLLGGRGLDAADHLFEMVIKPRWV